MPSSATTSAVTLPIARHGCWPARTRAVTATPTFSDPVIQEARNCAVTFTKALRDYVVKEYTTRYA